jgi:adenosylmethionine-8-amino-7-oxononanoate aminotransferase
MCGMGRTGSLHAWEQENAAPDIEYVAKGLGGGYQPIGAVLAAEKISAALESGSGGFVHGHTYQAHPIACAAALAVQNVIAAENLLDAVRRMGARLASRLRERFGDHAHVGDIRGRGLLQAIELVEDRGTKVPFHESLKIHARIKTEALRLGLACYPMGGTIDGLRGDHVLIAPPYIAESADIDRIVEILGAAVDTVTQDASLARRHLAAPR